MTSTASRNRRRRVSLAFGSAAIVAAAVLGASASRASAAEVTAATAPEAAVEAAPGRVPNPFADRFPNLVLRAHDGRNVLFYDDLLKDKIVLINFMYATCTER